jgi:hypothetical protein
MTADTCKFVDSFDNEIVAMGRRLQDSVLQTLDVAADALGPITSYCAKDTHPDTDSTILVSDTTVVADGALSDTELWHKKLGHISIRRLQNLLKNDCTIGIPSNLIKRVLTESASIQQCRACILGKMQKTPFTMGAESHLITSRVGELLHFDLTGGPNMDTIRGERYAIIIIDDYSRYIWIGLLKRKDDAISKFMNLICQLDRHNDTKVKTIHMDGGGEGRDLNFRSACERRGIRFETTNPHSPEQNAVAEKAIATLTDMTRTFLLDAGAPQALWGEAMMYAAYVKNRTLFCKKREEYSVTPFELLFGKKPDLSDLHVWGSVAYCHVAKSTRTKWAPKALECVFIGVPDGIKGLKFVRPGTGNYFTARSFKILQGHWFNWQGADYTRWQNHRGNEYQAPVPALDEVLDVDSGVGGASIAPTANDNVQLGRNQHVAASPSSGGDVTGNNGTSGGDANDINDEIAHDSAVISADVVQPIVTADDQITQAPETHQSDDSRPVTTRYGREIRCPTRFKNDSLFINSMNDDNVDWTEPDTVQQALKSKIADKWKEAMLEEHRALQRNETWELIDLPPGKNVVDCKWIFTVKTDLKTNKKKCKARLVARGFTQIPGVDYNETFSPVVKHATIRLLIAFATLFDFDIDQMDVRAAYLHGDIDTEILMKQPEGFTTGDPRKRVCRLKKALYGLKQSGMLWNVKIRDFLCEIGFEQSKSDPGLYYQKGKNIWLILFVDDMLIIGKDNSGVAEIKRLLKEKFEITDFGQITKFLNWKVTRNRENSSITIDQVDYCADLLETFGLVDKVSRNTPISREALLQHAEKITGLISRSEKDIDKDFPYRKWIGKLSYLSLGTRPDLAFAVNYLSQFVGSYNADTIAMLTNLIRYLHGTKSYSLKLSAQDVDEDNMISAYVDASYGGDCSDRKSQTGWILMIGKMPFSWRSVKQEIVTLSTTESEYLALCDCAKEVLWLKGLLAEINLDVGRIPIYVDSNSCLELAKHTSHHMRTKHIDIRYHFLREEIAKKTLEVIWIPGKEMKADFLTKPMDGSRIKMFAEDMRLF